MEISERDIFDYIFSPENLSPEMVSYLRNSNDFARQINFYSELKDSFAIEIPDILKLKIASKIPAYQPYISVLLYPVEKAGNDESLSSTNVNDEEKEVSTQIFSDAKKDYVLKLLNYQTHSKLFTFNTSGKKMSNFRIKFHPGSIEHQCNDNKDPLIIKNSISPENIELYIQN